MKSRPWTRLQKVLAELDRALWRAPDEDTRRLARVIMTFKHTKSLTSSRLALGVPPPANDSGQIAGELAR